MSEAMQIDSHDVKEKGNVPCRENVLDGGNAYNMDEVRSTKSSKWVASEHVESDRLVRGLLRPFIRDTVATNE
jgi:hypothetical protein